MDFLSIALATVLGLGLGWLLVRRQNADYTKIRVLKRNDFIQNMRRGQLVDVRKKEAYDTDKIKGARNFQPRELSGKYIKLRKDQAVYLYCQNGRKSKSIAKNLIRKEFDAVFVLEGGMNAYNNPN